VLCGEKDVVGKSLPMLLQCELEVPHEGRTVDVEVNCRTQQQVHLTISRRGQTVAVVAKQLAPTLDSLAAAGRALIEQARIESQLLDLGRAVVGAGSEEELVATVAPRRESAVSSQGVLCAHRRPEDVRAHLAVRRGPAA
jgi:hypothetical protein